MLNTHQVVNQLSLLQQQMTTKSTQAIVNLNNIITDRLTIRQFTEAETDDFSQMNADPEVMRYFDQTMTYQESIDCVERILVYLGKYGYGYWSVWKNDTQGKPYEWIGFMMLSYKDEKSGLPNVPLIEIGWTFKQDSWGNGHATESAKAIISQVFANTDLQKIYAHTALANIPSQRVMEKVGFVNEKADFIHELVDPDSGVNQYCVWTITRKKI